MKHAVITGLLCLVGLLCSPVSAANDNAPFARVAGSGWIADTPTKVADALELFNPSDADDSTPRVRVDYYNSGQQALHHLLLGEAEFALTVSTPLAIALLEHARDGAVPEAVILATVSLSNQSHYIVANRSRGIETPADLNGKRIGVMFDTSAHFGWTQFTALHELAGEGIMLVDVPIDRQEDAMVGDLVDAVVTWDPWGDRIRRALGERGIRFSIRQIYTVDWLLVTRRDVVDRSPGLADRVVDGYRRAIELIDRDPVRARTLHSRIGGVPVETLEALERGTIWRLGLNWSALANMETQFHWLSERPDYAGIPPPGPNRYLEAGPLSRVAPERLSLPPFLYRITE